MWGGGGGGCGGVSVCGGEGGSECRLGVSMRVSVCGGGEGECRCMYEGKCASVIGE